jgi:HAD superfamily hydrolase (TIGR01509 family)
VAGKLALLFDLDGTLVDTDSLHLGAYQVLLGELGTSLTLADYHRHIMGAPNEAIMAYLFPDHNEIDRVALVERKEALVRAAIDTLHPTAGLLALLDWADARGVRYGVVTNAPRPNAELMLTGLGLAARFPVLVIGDELSHGKPHPLPYLTGLQKFDAAPEHTLAFEDSLSGIRAATAAGLYTYGIRTALSDATLLATGARTVIGDFTDAELWAHMEALLA